MRLGELPILSSRCGDVKGVARKNDSDEIVGGCAFL
jgi:hypothetical protein